MVYLVFVFMIVLAAPGMSRCRQNYHENCEAAVNKQVNVELHASYVYLSMAYYFGRDDVALPGFAKYFQHQSDEERQHAQMFMKYQNDRGGRLMFHAIDAPGSEWGSGLEAMKCALNLEKSVNTAILGLHKEAEQYDDFHFMDFLESNFLTEQVDSIKELADHVTKLQRIGSGLGEFEYDKKLFDSTPS